MKKTLDIIPLMDWFEEDFLPMIVAGPCSAETEEQVLTTAKEIAKIKGIKVFRAGLWKPRTRPDRFEGIGEKGFAWLKKVKEETGLLTTTEVATPHHVEACLKNNIDILWIGSRTVVNPFSVKEITESLKGVDIPVMVKNPINPDLNLWLGALERMNFVGIKKLIAIHRGFYALRKSVFRNPPMWEIPIELKRIAPNLPIITDPSHICGNRKMLFHISQKAFDLEMNGLMIESHINPAVAKSDADQQIVPKELDKLLSKIEFRKSSGSVEFQNKLSNLRREIDNLDNDLIEILANRMDTIKEIGYYKKENKITILQLKRWTHIIEDRINNGVNQGLSKEFLIKLLELVHIESIRIQNEIMNM